jgi:hypothetical protein
VRVYLGFRKLKKPQGKIAHEHKVSGVQLESIVIAHIAGVSRLS